MAVSNLIVKQDYVCNGVTDTFAIPFSFIKVEQLKVFLINQATGLETPWVMGSEYDLDPPYDPFLPLNYINIIATTPPASGNVLRLIRVTSMVQDAEYENSGQLLLEELEKSFDKLTYMVQELDQRLDNVPSLASIDQDQIAAKLAKGAPLQVLAISPDGLSLRWMDIGDIGAGSIGLPTGGDVGDVLAKTGPGAMDLTWEQFNYSGYSGRFGQLVNLSGLKAVVDWLIDLSYIPPTISLSGSSNVLREKGDTVSGITLTAAIVRTLDPIVEVRFYRNPSTLLDTQNAGGAIPNGGNSTYVYGTSFSDNATFRAEADDDGASGGPTTVTATTTYNFVYPYYVGAGSAGLSAAAVAALTKRIIASTADRTEVIVAASGNVFYFAYPASYGALVSILDVNNFETIGDWTLRTENITGLDGNPVSYRIYEFNNPSVAGSYQYRFRR